MSSQFVHSPSKAEIRWFAATRVLWTWNRVLSRLLDAGDISAEDYCSLKAFWEVALGKEGAKRREGCVCEEHRRARPDEFAWESAQRAAGMLAACDAQLARYVPQSPERDMYRNEAEPSPIPASWLRCRYCFKAFDPADSIGDDYRTPPYRYCPENNPSCLGCWLGVGPPDLAREDLREFKEEFDDRDAAGRPEALKWLGHQYASSPEPARATSLPGACDSASAEWPRTSADAINSLFDLAQQGPPEETEFPGVFEETVSRPNLPEDRSDNTDAEEPEAARRQEGL